MVKLQILLVFFHNFVNYEKVDSVNFVDYNQSTNKAEILFYERKPLESLGQYKRAFEVMEPNVTDLVNASIVASVCKEKLITSNFLTKAFSKGFPLKAALRKRMIRKYLGKNTITNLYNKADKSAIDDALVHTLDSLIQIDQSNRSNKGFADKSIDFQNADFLRKIIVKTGFPSEDRIGYYPSLFLLFQHNLGFWLSEENYPIIKEELLSGNISPELYALLHDRMKLHSTIFKERDYYLPYNFLGNNSRRKKFSVIPIDNFMNIDLIPEINERRRKIGLQSVEDSQKINEKGFTKRYQLIISDHL